MSAKQSFLLAIAISIASAILLFLLWPTDLVNDDVGITLKYMDNFAAGHFYCYNPSDGPVYGLSSFIHGVFSGALAYFHVFSPINSLLASNFTGIVLVSLLTLMLLSLHLKDHRLILVAWLLLLTGTPNFVLNSRQGLETPLHLAIILSCFWYFLRNQSRRMWLALIVAMISKLDALPIVAVLGAGYLLRNALLKDRRAWKAVAGEILVFFALPAVVWTVFCFAVFGSPVPQSALAKMYYHTHTSSDWCPFRHGFGNLKEIYYFMYLMAGVYLVSAVKGRRFTEIIQVLIPGLSALAFIGLYCIYKPREQMSWYYSVPEFLLVMQAIVLTAVNAQRLLGRYRTFTCLGLFLVMMTFSAPKSLSRIEHQVNYLAICETERMAVGDWLRRHSAPQDTLLAAHGHIARRAGIYTVDFSGINSKAATDCQLIFPRLVDSVKPHWIAKHGLMGMDIEEREGYILRKSFYNISGVYKYPTWRIYERNPGEPRIVAKPVAGDMVQTDGMVFQKGPLGVFMVEGSVITIAGLNSNRRATQFHTGLAKVNENLTLTVFCYNGDQALLHKEQLFLKAKDVTEPLNGYTQEWIVALENFADLRSLVIQVNNRDSGEAASVRLVEPVIMEVAR